MNVQLLISKVLADPNTEIKPSPLLTLQEINKDPYLVSAYYNHNPYVRLVTTAHLINENINGVQFPKVKRMEDIPDYAFDMIVEQGRALIFLEPGSGYAILKQFDTKRFLTFGKQRSVPFGLSNFTRPIPNELNITQPFTYGKPILIVEGLRDCLDAQTIYPYTLAMQTSSIPSLVKEVLHTLTDTIILALDNDDAGQKGIKNLKYKKEFNYLTLNYPDNYKDIGTLSQLYYKDPFSYNYYKSFLATQLAVIYNGKTF